MGTIMDDYGRRREGRSEKEEGREERSEERNRGGKEGREELRRSDRDEE